MICYNCNSNLCYSCDKIIHEQIKSSQHKKKLFSTNKFGICSCEHKLEVEFFCKDCKKCICSRCKYFGDHSDQIAKNHLTVDIESAKNEISIENLENINIIKNEKKKIRLYIESLILISSKLRDNCKKIIDKDINDAFENEIKELQGKSSEKLKRYISSINQLLVNKDVCGYFNNYFIEKETIVKDIYNAEFIWLWFNRKKFIDQIFSNNLKGIDKFEYQEPNRKDIETENKVNVNVLEFIIEQNIKNYDIPIKEIKIRADDKKFKYLRYFYLRLFENNQSLNFIENTKKICIIFL